MKDLKEAIDIPEQIKRLKEHGLIVKSDDIAEKILRDFNYYTLRGYAEYGGLIDPDSLKREDGLYQYNKDITIEKIYSIFEFDRKIKKEILYLIGILEKHLRVCLSLFISTYLKPKLVNGKQEMVYLGPECYFEKNIYSSSSSFAHNVQMFQNAIDKNRYEYNTRLTDDPIISHHENEYNGRYPIWVIIEYLEFGKIISFIFSLNNKIKNSFLNSYFHTQKQKEVKF